MEIAVFCQNTFSAVSPEMRLFLAIYQNKILLGNDCAG